MPKPGEGTPGGGRHAREYRYTEGFLSALSLLGTTRSGWESITACAIDIPAESPTISTNVTIRIAQNNTDVSVKTITFLQQILHRVLEFVNGEGGRQCRGKKRSEQYNILARFATSQLMPYVAKACINKISATITQRRKAFSVAFDQLLSKADLDEAKTFTKGFSEFISELNNFGNGEGGDTNAMCCISLGVTTSQFCLKNQKILYKLWQKVLNEGPGGL